MGSFIIGAFMVCKFPAVATWNVIEPQKERFSACVLLSQLFSLVFDTPYHVRHAEKM